MKIIAVASLKGGAGKTAISIFLSQLLSENKRVLAIDLDHNNNMTDYFLRDIETEKIESANVYHALAGTRDVQDCIHTLSAIDVSILPATPALARIGLELARDPGAILRFARSMKQLNFEMIVIDTPPALCFELSCALYAASVVLSPVSFSRWTVQGFSLLREEICNVREAVGRGPRLLALPVQVNAMQEKKLRITELSDFTKVGIRRSASIKSACDSGKQLKRSTGSYAEFKALAEELC
ncbi:MAG TPA: AAA family ATPase [Leptospiraceae bacterium]|nr:AAA family ATPase [Leptospiraceae bacterium]HMW58031.1 AAA family ATPase [Leptospiraceae bacterium]HMY43825.1 AAA family ATPase [Leptospiraceae bacterium]HMZ36138.1 AAA family ATPase [Leptospiraceae bacterium]HNJ02644.1 AAA family ATPase [Leptospiraceae bacterium]